MIVIDCVSPRYLAVYPKGSLLRKDGSLGSIVRFVPSDAFYPLPDEHGEVPAIYQVPCGKCLACRQNKARAWSIRLQMEMQYYKPSEVCFLTLTYDDSHLPLELRHDHVQRFLHSIRCRLDRDYGVKLRYFMCGEYGSRRNTMRPHYHLILFGFDFFVSSKLVGRSKSGLALYSNQIISDYWPYGYAEFGLAGVGSAMYTSQYAQKKLILREDYGDLTPPYIQMSRRPGIGSRYIEDHKDQILRDRGVYMSGHFIPIDRYTIRYLFSHEYLSEKDKALIRLMYEERALDADRLWRVTHDGDKQSQAVFAAQRALLNLRAAALVKGGV